MAGIFINTVAFGSFSTASDSRWTFRTA